MSIIENIVRIFAPHLCLGCGQETDTLLCPACAQTIETLPPRCYRCLSPIPHFVVCRNCRDQVPFTQVLAFAPYRGLPKQLVHQLKFERAQAAASEIADLLATLSAHVPKGSIITHVPTATSRVRARGYDHARLIARSLSGHITLPHHTLLARSGQSRQVGAHRNERLRQLRAAFRPIRHNLIRGRNIVLVDDVLTTGATLETAAQVLLDAGAVRVSAIVLAQA